MKKFPGALVVLFFLPLVYAEQNADQPSEIVLHGESDQFQTQERDETTLYFPDFVDGGGWSVQLVLTNINTTATVPAVVAVYGQDGETVPDLFDSETSFEIPSLGNRVLRSEGEGRIRRGWIEVQTSKASVNGLLTYRNVRSGIEVGVESVELGDHFALFVEESNDIGTGLAIFKQDSSAKFELRIRDEEGRDPLDRRFVQVGDFNQRALTIPEWIGLRGYDTGFLRDFSGLLYLRTEDGSPFAPLGLRFGKRTDSLSAVPVIRIIDEDEIKPDLDLVVESASVSDTNVKSGAAFTFMATVRNRGNIASSATTLRYYRSPVARISPFVMELDTDPVSTLSASGTSDHSVSLTAPASPGTYYYGACVDTVSNESDTENNCSTWVEVTVEAAPAPDLAVESPTVSNSSPAAGQSFTLSATVRNQGAGDATSSVYLHYYRSADAMIETNDTEVGSRDYVGFLDASETSDESIVLTAPSNPGTYYYGACVETVPDESDTGNNCSSAVEVTVGAAPAPDLVVESPTVSDSNPTAGNSFDLSATVRNQGAGRSSSSTTLRYYRSTDATISAGDTEVGTDYVGSLDASRTSDESIRLTAPSSPGTYYYGACVETVPDESDTGNNCSSAVEVTVGAAPAPDLVVESPTVSDSNPAAGNSFDLSATVRNQGTARSRSFTTLRYYRSTDATISARDTEFGTDSVGFLDASETSNESIRLTAPSSPGTYYYGACVDTVSDESDIENNCSSGVEVTVGAAPAPDLVVESPRVSDRSPVAGESFTFSAKVRNQGPGDATESVYLHYYRSADATIGTGDTEVGFRDYVGFLDASETSDESISLTAPSSPGTYYYGACVDAVSNESDTGNNCSSAVEVTVRPAPPSDLVVESPAVSNSSPAAGQSFTLSATVRNQGAGDATSSAYLHYYRSADATIGTSDTEVGSRDYVGFLDASETSDESIVLTAPSSPGTYYYGACVETVPDESDTGNNCSSAVEVTVRPAPPSDLVVESPAVSNSSPAAGQSFTLSATVRNQGAGRSWSSTTLRYYRSTDATISAGDTEVGTDYVGSLDASRTSDESIRLTAPSSPGTYYYGACVDAVSNESDTGNNCSRSVRVAVVAAADLVVGSPAVSDSTPATGQSFDLRATVRNQGDGRSPSTTLRYYRSTDTKISSSDTEVGTDDVASLAADGTSDESTRLTLPDGCYFCGACVDPVDNEAARNNNCSEAVKVVVGGPFLSFDLDISRIVLHYPVVGFIGEPIRMTVDVTNRGPDASRPAKLRFSNGSSLDIPALDAGEKVTYERHRVGSVQFGRTTYRACIVAPCDEAQNNNCESKSVTYGL